MEQNPSVLNGIRVVDFSWVWTGPLTTRILANFGAQVIRIESMHRPDLFRTVGPYKDKVPGINRGGIFAQDNTSKLSVTVNLAKPEGMSFIKKLISLSDIVIENFAGGVIQRMGLGYRDIAKIKPDIIMLSTCMMGNTGPYSALPGYGYLLAAYTGMNSMTGYPDRDPSGLGSYTDFIQPYYNISAILAALDYRERTGKGQYLDASQFEISLQFQAPMLLDFQANGKNINRIGNRHTQASPHSVYRCRGNDRWCAITIFSDDEWLRFCAAMGTPSWCIQARFQNLASRQEHEDELDKLVESWTILHTNEHVMHLLQQEGIRAGILQNAEDIWEDDPQLRYCDFFQQLEHPEIGQYRAPKPPFTLSNAAPLLESSPTMGQHTEYVCKTILQLSDEEVADLLMKNVLE